MPVHGKLVSILLLFLKDVYRTKMYQNRKDMPVDGDITFHSKDFIVLIHFMYVVIVVLLSNVCANLQTENIKWITVFTKSLLHF